LSQGQRIAVIRTSDRAQFRSCRRAWNWSSPLRGNRTAEGSYTPFWLGTGFHFALEDYHGYNRYTSPINAFQAYVTATRQTGDLPDDWEFATDLACDMLRYYVEDWLTNRDPLETYWYNGEPQVEVRYRIPLPIEHPDYDAVYYDVTIDRVIIDEYDNLWLLDYKTAARFETFHLPTDDQVSSYCWGMHNVYDRPISGMVYQQHLKDFPDPPEFLKSSHRFSVNHQQRTTSIIYRKALLDLYGSLEKAPTENVRFLQWLEDQEGEHYDRFIRRDWVERNTHQVEAQGEKILMEVREMLDSDLPLYPNPTRGCSYCTFQSACVSFDDGSDWEFELEQTTIEKPEERDEWRQHLPEPSEVV